MNAPYAPYAPDALAHLACSAIQRIASEQLREGVLSHDAHAKLMHTSAHAFRHASLQTTSIMYPRSATGCSTMPCITMPATRTNGKSQTMTQKPKKRKAAKRAAPLSREDLLPLAGSLSRHISLKNHMALSVFKTGQGNLDLAGDLLKTLYWTFYLSDSGEVSALEADFVAAERGLKACLIGAHDTDTWSIADAHALHLEAILRLHDRQLGSLPVYQLEKAKRRLARIMEKDEGFPTFAIERGSREYEA